MSIEDDLRRIEANFDRMQVCGHRLLVHGERTPETDYWFRVPTEAPVRYELTDKGRELLGGGE